MAEETSSSGSLTPRSLPWISAAARAPGAPAGLRAESARQSESYGDFMKGR